MTKTQTQYPNIKNNWDNLSITPIEENIKDAKQRLRKALSANCGVIDADVRKVIKELAAMNPTASSAAEVPATRSPLLIGKWKSISSLEFPNRIFTPEKGKEDIFRHTLGAVSFEIFQPSNLVCTVGQLQSPIDVLEWDESGDECSETESESESETEGAQSPTLRSVKKMTYPCIVPITIHTPKGDLNAVMRVNGEAYASTDKRIVVHLDAGTLSPSSELVTCPEKMELWKETFAGAYSKAERERSYMSRLFRNKVLKLFGVTFPSDELAAESNYIFRCEVKRPPKAFVDMIYLDDDLRITKDYRGTYLVAERVKK